MPKGEFWYIRDGEAAAPPSSLSGSAPDIVLWLLNCMMGWKLELNKNQIKVTLLENQVRTTCLCTCSV